MSQRMHRSGSVSQFGSRLRELSTFPYNHGSSASLSHNESMHRSPHQCNNSRDLNRNHCIRNGSASQVSQHMHRSGSVSQFDSILCELSTFANNHGSSAFLSRNGSMLRSPYQCNNSRDLDRDHCGNYEQRFCFMRFDFHIILKNVQSLFSDLCILALNVDLNTTSYDICCITET